MIKQLYTRDNLLKVARRSDSADADSAVSLLRSRARSGKREFYNNSFEDNKNNARAIWKTMKTLTGSKRSAQQITSLRVDWRDVDDATEMADPISLICSRHSGFRRKHSTETPLIKIIDELLFNVESKGVRHGSSGLSKGARHG